MVDGGGNGFSGANARWDDPAGRHLRINNPLGAAVELRLPTTEHTHPVLTYEARRSGRGAGLQLVEYSLDGIQFEEFAKIIVFDEDPIVYRLDFSEIEGAADNPDFRIRIRFPQGKWGIEGNHRIDNIALEGREIWIGSIFEGSETTVNFGARWKWNGLGYFYDRHYPFVYSTGLDSWIYVVGEDESSFYFWDYRAERWGGTGSALYPRDMVFSGADAGEWVEVAP